MNTIRDRGDGHAITVLCRLADRYNQSAANAGTQILKAFENKTLGDDARDLIRETGYLIGHQKDAAHNTAKTCKTLLDDFAFLAKNHHAHWQKRLANDADNAEDSLANYKEARHEYTETMIMFQDSADIAYNTENDGMDFERALSSLPEPHAQTGHELLSEYYMLNPDL